MFALDRRPRQPTSSDINWGVSRKLPRPLCCIRSVCKIVPRIFLAPWRHDFLFSALIHGTSSLGSFFWKRYRSFHLQADHRIYLNGPPTRPAQGPTSARTLDGLVQHTYTLLSGLLMHSPRSPDAHEAEAYYRRCTPHKTYMCLKCPHIPSSTASGSHTSSPQPSYHTHDDDYDDEDERGSTSAFSVTSSDDPRPSVVHCGWGNCHQPLGTLRRDIADHLADAHGIAQAGQDKTLVPCGWTGCSSVVLNISVHVQRSHMQRFDCVCGRSFGREDARRRHVDRGTCEKVQANEPGGKQGGRPAIASRQIAEVYRKPT
jgi:hypothetical protein